MNLKTVLIVEDDADDMAVLVEAIGMIDANVHCIGITDGEQAMKFLRKDIARIPDMIFLDIQMPVLNGKKTLEKIRCMTDLTSVPVIIYSAEVRRYDADEFLRIGASGFLVKTFSPVKLSAAILIVFSKLH